MHLVDAGPVVLLLKDGSATVMVGADADRNVVFLRDPRALASEIALAVDELRLERVWSGEAVLLRAQRGQMEADAPFTLSWLSGLVLQEKSSLRDIGLASLTLSFLTIFPPLLVMTVVDKVLTHHSYSTLMLLGTILAIATIYEAVLGYARRLIVMVIGARLDAKLNLHVFNRLLRLPLDYFERHPAGETMHKVAQVYKVREFLTGKLLATFLDMMTLAVLLPFLFYLNSSLAFVVLACSALIVLVVLAYLRPLQRVFTKVIVTEAEKAAALGETIFGIKTVKSLALEPQRRMLWDARVAEAGKSRLAFGKLANWPQTIVNPIERFMSIGIVLVGAYIAMTDKTGYAVGVLFAFMMLSMRVAQPLAGLARLIENYEEVGAAISEAASVLNRPLEYDALSRGLRPQHSGAIAFDDVSFTYGSTKIPVPVDNQIRTYWWCRPPRIGRQRIWPARSTAHPSARRGACARHCNISCMTAARDGGGTRRARQRGQGIPVGSNRSAVRHIRFAMGNAAMSADRECPLIESVGRKSPYAPSRSRIRQRGSCSYPEASVIWFAIHSAVGCVVTPNHMTCRLPCSMINKP
jgi:subfamily B ATP-binding cassette protein HlyB/CyaB